jgi:tetratricopeptide (TPR) repeat protein
VPAPFPNYDPVADARLFSLDAAALALLEHDTPSEVVAAALLKARAHLHEHEAEGAETLLEALLTRADVTDTARIEPLLLLAEARLDQGQFAGAVTSFEEALKLDPLSPKTQLLYARASLGEAKRLYALGKRRWYENDDEDLLTAARDLLTRLDALTQIDPTLKAEVDELAERLAKEL